MSHLPPDVLTSLTYLGQEVDEALQSEAHAVGTAQSASEDYDQGWVESHLRRAHLYPSVRGVRQNAFGVEELKNGGCEIVSHCDSIERRFRWRRARLNREGRLVVTANTDSILTHAARTHTLWDSLEDRPPSTVQQWVLAYSFDRNSGGLGFLFAGWVSGTRNENAPYILTFVDPIDQIPLAAPEPPPFRADDEDLDLGDDEGEEEEGHSEEAG